MYLGSWKIDDVLYVPVATVDWNNPGAGVQEIAADAAFAPTYRVYENNTTTPILTGTSSLFDSGNTIGLYQVALTLSAANGFEQGKSYLVYVEYTDATNGQPHSAIFFFQIQAEVRVVSLATDALAAASAAAAFCNKIADHVRRRTQANVEASSDGDALSAASEYGVIQQHQEANTTAHAGKLTVYKTDGTTELAQLTLATDAGADPVTGIS